MGLGNIFPAQPAHKAFSGLFVARLLDPRTGRPAEISGIWPESPSIWTVAEGSACALEHRAAGQEFAFHTQKGCPGPASSEAAPHSFEGVAEVGRVHTCPPGGQNRCGEKLMQPDPLEPSQRPFKSECLRQAPAALWASVSSSVGGRTSQLCSPTQHVPCVLPSACSPSLLTYRQWERDLIQRTKHTQSPQLYLFLGLSQSLPL